MRTASKGHGLYPRHGIEKLKYVDGQYQALDERLREARKVITIGFEIEEAYLANALELHLIAQAIISKFDREFGRNFRIAG